MPADNETSFQRAMRIADERKAQQWREYRQRDPLPKAAFEDYEIKLEPILMISSEMSQRDRRSSRQVRMYDHAYIVKRPTEMKAFERARGDNWRDSLHVVRQEPSQQTRYCYGCNRHHPLSEFDWQKQGKRRPVEGYHWYCRLSLRKKSAQRYKRAA